MYYFLILVFFWEIFSSVLKMATPFVFWTTANVTNLPNYYRFFVTILNNYAV
jgi:hypothetical protein